jgi:arylsulfatase A-like enzyme
MPDRPNILLLHVDQFRFDCLGVNGARVVRTPNLDRLAAGGVNYSHAFTPSPMCVPARCSLLTGQWPTTHGVVFNYDAVGFKPLDPNAITFSRVLNEAGYWLGAVGKWQADPKLGARDYHFHKHSNSWQYHIWRRSQNLPDRPNTNGFFGETDPYITPEQSRLAWGADETIRILRERAAAAGGAGDGKPFFLRWDTDEPHLPNIVPEPYASMYPPASVPPWPGFGDDLAGKPYIQAQQLRTWGLDGWTWDKWAPIVGRYLGEVSLIDAQVGRILDVLDELKLADNTLVVFSSDHGDMCGSHGMIDKHFVMYDDVARVPLIARWPGHLPAAGACDAFLSHEIDLAFTFCQAAGLTPPASFQGRSILDAATGADPAPRQDIYASYDGNQFGLYSQRMLRDRNWKYVWNATAEDELYDLTADPGEIRNRATDPAAAEPLARLRGRLVAWMKQIKDPLLNQWTGPQILEGRKK